MALTMVQRSAAGCDTLGVDGDGAFRELANKIEAFQCFRQADPPAVPARDPYRSLWSFEGLGYARAEREWNGAAPPHGLLAASDLPQPLRIPFHTGMGLCFASRLLGRGVDLRRDLEEFFDLCAANAGPGLEEAAREALGLVTRNLRPDLLPEAGRILRALGEQRAASFWHGVGRGLYFAPTGVLPIRESRAWALAEARSVPPDELGRSNAVAGLVWALALVNLRHPRILEGFLREHEDRLPTQAAAHGVVSAILVWFDVLGKDRILTDFLEHRPDPVSGGARRWEELVRLPCLEALERTWPVLHRENRCGDLFFIPARAGVPGAR